jgi:hypothetical protein
MAHPLDGVWAKLDRARLHLDDLHTCMARLFTPKQDGAATAAHEYNSDRQELIVRLPKATPTDPSFPLLVGDCIHNARSALDHLVFQLAILNRAPSAAANKTMFPVCLTPEQFRDSTARKVAPFVSGATLAEIEKLQPYATGNADAEDILWVLSQLDIIDKHRLLLVTVSKFRPVAFTVTVPTGEQFAHEIPSGKWKPSADGAEIIRFDLSSAIKQQGKVHVKIKTASSVQIESTGMVCDGMPVEAVLSDCIQHTINIVGGFQEMFFGA